MPDVREREPRGLNPEIPKRYIGETANGRRVYMRPEVSHAATHLADTPELLGLIQELLPTIQTKADNHYAAYDMGRIVGLTDLVETTEEDEIVYAIRPNRDNFTRFVKDRDAQPTSFVTIVLRRDGTDEYDLRSAWIGEASPQFPGDAFATDDSVAFWRHHALVWGNQEIIPGTEVDAWPWDDMS